MTNHGVEDKVVNFLTCHKLSEVDRVCWFRRVEDLRKIYADRQQSHNPLNGGRKHYDLKEIKGIISKVEVLEKEICELREMISDLKKSRKNNSGEIATSLLLKTPPCIS